MCYASVVKILSSIFLIICVRFLYSLERLKRVYRLVVMKEGGKWELYIPSELGYGDRGAGAQIPGGAVLVFTLELLEVLGPAAEDK